MISECINILSIYFLRYNGPNLVLKYNRNLNRLLNIAVDDPNSPYHALRDTAGNAIGVTACDVDGDGREEIYFLNTNDAYSGKYNTFVKQFYLKIVSPMYMAILMIKRNQLTGQATYTDKLFKFRNGRFEDLLSDELNIARGVANRMAGRSVACIDRKVDKMRLNFNFLLCSLLAFSMSISYSIVYVCSAGDGPLLGLRGQLRQGERRPPRALRNG